MLEVEASGHPVHIKQFTGEVQAGMTAALHRGDVHLPQGHAAGGDELLPEAAAAAHPLAASAQGHHQALLLQATQVGPALL